VLASAAVNVCTIIAKNYLAYARVLAKSLSEQHPGSRLWTLIVDDFRGYVDPADEPFITLAPADVDCEPFTHMALRYSVLELSTAVKPWLMRHLMRETGQPVTYLDPDIRIYDSLARLDELGAQHGVVLIPHNDAPLPPDGRAPSQVDIMIAGVYNLGAVTLAPSPEVDQLIDWWADRLRRDCRVDPIWGYFVDQRWFDLAPGFLSDVAILRDPEYNVAYWNLHARRLERAHGRWLVNGRPLAFFHFSGFDPDHPLVLSRYQDRVDVTAEPALEQILAEYAVEVNRENHAVSRKWPYAYGALGDGTRLDSTLRALYSELDEERNGELPSPFTLEGARMFADWVNQQAPGSPPGISRVLARVYEDRPDLRVLYPDLDGPGRAGLLRWVEEYGRREIPLLKAMTANTNTNTNPADAQNGSGQTEPPQAAKPLAPGEPATTLGKDPFGVNVVGYFRSEVGTGEAARQVVSALDAVSIPVMPIHGQTIPLSRQGHTYTTGTPEDAAFPLNLICMNADMLPEFTRQVGEEFFADRYSIGLWFWEIDEFPARWHGSLSLLEEVWAPTAHVASALEPISTIPVTTVRIPIEMPALEPRTRGDLGLPEDKFLFLFSFDYLSVFKRKNPLAVIDAFTRAFAPGESVGLVIKCINQDRDPSAHAELRAAAAAHPGIEVIDRYLDPLDNRSLTALCDCYVSLHRAEGFGLGPAEAMWLGKPVIATGYSGNLDFMTPENSLLVDYRLVPIGAGADPYPADARWADPDVQHAATLMRGLVDDPERARRLGETAAADIRRTHSPSTAGQIMRRRLEAIRATGRPRAGIDPARKRPALAALPIRIRQGPVQGARPGRAQAVRELARTAVLRLMKPYTVYQQTIDTMVVDALDDLSASIVAHDRENAAERAALISELRAYEQLSEVIERQARTIEALEQRLDMLEREQGRRE
jgi:glycosyltransferase involved in cell wall biosynthesis